MKNIISTNIPERKEILNNIKEKKQKSTYIKEKPITTKRPKLTDEEKQKIIEILKKIKVYILKGYFDSARGLIIEGLAIDKFNKDLNIELASIYEKEKKFQNAEYIYRDLSEVLKDDFEIKKKLAFNLAMQSKFELSIQVYEQAHKEKKSDNEIITMLSELTYNMKQYKKCLVYLTLFLKEKPRDVEKMFMKCVCLESQGFANTKEISDVMNVYKKILELQPYNTLARDRLKSLDQQLQNDMKQD